MIWLLNLLLLWMLASVVFGVTSGMLLRRSRKIQFGDKD